MKNIRTSIREHKKLFCIMGLVFVVCLECCVFPVGSSMLGGNSISIFINFATAVAIGKCVGEIEVIMLLFSMMFWVQTNKELKDERDEN